MDPKVILVPVPLANGLVQYLARQPYGEVAELIQALAQLQPVDLPVPAEKPHDWKGQEPGPS